MQTYLFILGDDGCRKAKVGVVGQLDRLLLGLKGGYAHDGPKHLLGPQRVVSFDLREDGWLYEVADGRQMGWLASAGQQRNALLLGLLHFKLGVKPLEAFEGPLSAICRMPKRLTMT